MDQEKNTKRQSPKLVIPFFAVLAALAVIAAIVPLRPTVSYDEKRELAKFPAFSWEALLSGSFFDDITLWYSDTFPGREGWLEVSQMLSSLHGYGSIAIEGQLPELVEVPEIPAPTRPPETVPEIPSEEPTEAPAEESTETVPAETEQEDGEILLDATFSSSSVVQIGGSAYQPLGFSQQHSDRYIKILNTLAAAVEPKGVRVVSAPPPLAIGTMVDAKYLPELRSADQEQTLRYLHESMVDSVVTVDTHNALIPHRDEYLFFHGDHHWTALAAYYCYQATCEAMGLEAADLEDFEVLDQGEFRGTLRGKARYPYKLTQDYVISYIPPGDISLTCYGQNGGTWEGTVIRDLRNDKVGSKYLCFLEGDQPLVCMTNHDLPEDAGNCLILKDSFGNCFVPYFSQNYRNVYAIDYRKYHQNTIQRFVEAYDIQDVIIAPNLMSIQSDPGTKALGARCGLHF